MKLDVENNDELLVTEYDAMIYGTRDLSVEKVIFSMQTPKGYVTLDEFAHIFEQKMTARYAEL